MKHERCTPESQETGSYTKTTGQEITRPRLPRATQVSPSHLVSEPVKRSTVTVDTGFGNYQLDSDSFIMRSGLWSYL